MRRERLIELVSSVTRKGLSGAEELAQVASESLSDDECRVLAAKMLYHLAIIRLRKQTVSAEQATLKVPRHGTREREEWERSLEGQQHATALQRARAAVQEEFFRDVKRTVAQLVHRVEVEFTTTLLRSEFVLPGGQVATWGNATVEQHEIRYNMLLKNAIGNLETLALHAKAIEKIKHANSETLDDIFATVAV